MSERLMDEMGEIKSRLIQAAQDGCFLAVLYKESRNDRENIGSLLSDLHNANQIDLVTEFLRLKRNEEEVDFFLARHLFQEALPSLNAPVDETMKCVRHLAEEAGDDLAAAWVYSQFIDFCAMDVGRAESVMEMVLGGSEEWLDFVCPGLLAGARCDLDRFVNKAIELCGYPDKDVRVRAVFSLGSINYGQNVTLQNLAIEAIHQSVRSNADSEICANAIKAYFEINKIQKIEERRFLELFDKSTENVDDMLIHAVSEKIFNQIENLPESILKVSLDIIAQVNPINKGTIDLLDITLKNLVDLGYADWGVELIERILKSNGNSVSIRFFDSFISSALTNKNGFFDQLATRWLGSRSSWLCVALPDMLSTIGGSPMVLNFNPLMVNCQDSVDHIFLARKACGWLFLDPVSAGSFIVSLLEHAPDESLTDISEILMNPLLISYSGDLRGYLETSLPDRSVKIQQLMRSIFLAVDNYHEDLDSVRDVKEFLPSLAHREISRRNLSIKMRENFRGAQEKSIISQIATKMVLLYGRKSIFYTRSLDGSPPARQESVMHTISHSIEHPALDRLDPHGLDHELRVFRYEGCVE